MNKIKWQLFHRALFNNSNEYFIYLVDDTDFPALLKLKHLNALEILIFTVLMSPILNSKEKNGCLSFQSLTDFLLDHSITANQINETIYRLNDLDLISIYITYDGYYKTQTLAFRANEKEIIEKGIYTPDKELNIWNLSNINKG